MGRFIWIQRRWKKCVFTLLSCFVFLMCFSRVRRSAHVFVTGETALWQYCPPVERDPSLTDFDAPVDGFVSDLNLTDGGTRSRYLVWRCDGGCGGYADRLKGIVSAYVWAWLLGRRFVIRQTKPCPLWILYPNHYNWNQSYPDVTSSDWRQVIYHSDSLDAVYELKHLDIKKFDDKKVLILYTNLDLIRMMLQNPTNRERLSSLSTALGVNIGTADPEVIYKALFPRVFFILFKLHSGIAQQLISFLSDIAKPRPDVRLVCTAVRVGGSAMFENSYFGRTVLGMFLMTNFISRIPGAIDGRFFYVDDASMSYIWKFVNQSLVGAKDYRLYVMTDSRDVIERMTDRYGPKMISIPGELTHLDRSSEASACLGMRKMILDWYVMTQCDYLGLTEVSKFGIYASWIREFVHPDVTKSKDKHLYAFRRKNLALNSLIHSNDIYPGL